MKPRKTKLLPLLLAAAVLLGLGGVPALAAEEAEAAPTLGASYTADAELLPAAENAAPQKAARAGGSIFISGTYVFAKGIPIVIKQNGSITSVYSQEGTLLSGETDVSSYAVYGGWSTTSNTYTADTSIVMESGTVKSLFGGNSNGTLNGNTHVVVQGGTITSLLYGGGNKSTINGNTYVTLNGGTAAWVYGGGQYGTVTGTANVTVNSGATVSGTVFGGGRNATVNSTNVTLNGGTVGSVSSTDGSIVGWVYGGGQEGSVASTHVQLKSGTCAYVYGGSRQGSVEQATVDMGVDWYPAGWVCAGGVKDTTKSAEVIVHNYATGDNEHVGVDATTAQKATVIVRRDDGGPLNQANPTFIYLYPLGTWNVVVEYGTVVLQTQTGKSITLDSLDIKPSAQLQFGDFEAIKINKVICSGGQFVRAAAHLSSTWEVVPPVPVELGEIVLNVPLIIRAYGWTDEILANDYFFYGAGVDALSSTDWLFVKNYDAVLKEIPGGGGAKGIYFQNKPDGTSIYISRRAFSQTPAPYNGTLSLTVGVAAQPADDNLVPGALLQIRGRNNRDVLFASIQVSADGQTATVTGMDGVTRPAQVDGGSITITLPVAAELLETCQEGLYVLATAPNNQYSDNVQLVGPNGETKIEITPTPITLQNTIPEPAFQDPLQSSLEEGAFYTASVLWRPADNTATNAFQVGRDYQADILLTPREGHWLSAASIGSTVIYNGQPVPCVFNPDGTVTLQNQKSVRFEGHTVTLAASPAQGGTVAGGGRYPAGAQVTVSARAAQGYCFSHWEEKGATVSSDPAYTFTLAGSRALTAVFLPAGTLLKVECNDLTTVPEGLAGKFATVEEIKAVLEQKVTAALSGVGDQMAIYDVRLQYRDTDGVWKDVDPNNFPPEGVTATLPYPPGTNGTDYTFTVQHMISHGARAGQVESLSYTAAPAGLQCRFTSLSPVAVGYRWQPAGSGSSSSGDEEDEYNFWQQVRQSLLHAQPGETLRVDAQSYDRMHWSVMDALAERPGVSLFLRWNGGEALLLPSSQALQEPNRIYYPLAYLAAQGFAAPQSATSQNPATGGVWAVAAPAPAEGAPLVVTHPQRGLAETPALAARGVEQTLPGVYEPAASTAPGGRDPAASLALLLLLAAAWSRAWVWKRRADQAGETR